jgi:hypothetical protein
MTAQVKVGNNPSSINVNAILELETTNRGLLLPRVALSSTINASPLSANVVGMSVYNTANAGTGNTAVSPGFYFNNGSQWVRIADASNLQNIYTVDGTLTGNRTVSQGSNTLNYTGTGVTTFNAGNVGIGTTSPSQRLDVRGNITNRGRYIINSTDGNTAGFITTTNELLTENGINITCNRGQGKIVFNIDDGSGISTERMRLLWNGNIGIGTNLPTQALDVAGNVKFSGALMPNNISGTSGQILSSSGTTIAPLWINYTPVSTPITASFPGGTSTRTWCQAAYWTGTFIDLPPGRWAISSTLTLNGGSALPSASGLQWHSSWSDVSTGTTYVATSDFVGNTTQYAGVVISPMQYGFTSGIIILNNTTTSTKRYYLWKTGGSINGSGASCSFSVLNYARGFHPEDQIIAYPMY